MHYSEAERVSICIPAVRYLEIKDSVVGRIFTFARIMDQLTNEIKVVSQSLKLSVAKFDNASETEILKRLSDTISELFEYTTTVIRVMRENLRFSITVAGKFGLEWRRCENK